MAKLGSTKGVASDHGRAYMHLVSIAPLAKGSLDMPRMTCYASGMTSAEMTEELGRIRVDAMRKLITTLASDLRLALECLAESQAEVRRLMAKLS